MPLVRQLKQNETANVKILKFVTTYKYKHLFKSSISLQRNVNQIQIVYVVNKTYSGVNWI